MTKPKADVLIVDGHNLFIRAAFGFDAGKQQRGEDRGLDSGAPATYQFLRMLRAAIVDCECKLVFLTFDRKSKFRFETYPAYKGDREKGKADPVYELVHKQLEEAQTLFQKIGCYYTRVDGWEADDLIWALCRAYPQMSKLMMTADQDMVQCCTLNCQWWDPRAQRLVYVDKNGILQGREAFTEVPVEMPCNGLTINQWKTFKSITAGDDNIKGAFRFGPVKARKAVFDPIMMSAFETQKFPRHRCDPLCEDETLTMTGREVLDRNLDLQDLDRIPDQNLLFKAIQTQTKRELDFPYIAKFLQEKKMYSLTSQLGDFLRPFQRLK